MTEPTDAQAVADYLATHPEFFENNPDLTASLKLSSALGGRTISLQDRQVEVLREKIRQLELKLSHLMRVARDNEAIIANFHQWTQLLWQSQPTANASEIIASTLRESFDLPAATVRLWDDSPETADARAFADRLNAPYCGPAQGVPGLSWLTNAAVMQSAALIPLRKTDSQETTGLLVLGSPDAQRFSSDMATDMLSRIGETVTAALEGLSR